MCSTVSATSDAEGTPQCPATVLCVDDSQSMLIICQTMLEASGYKVHTAENGKAALQELGKHAIDLVVVDDRMPGMSGAELAKEIKQLHNNLPVLMFSDSSDKPISSKSVDLFMNKMSGPRALCVAVTSLLSEFRRVE
jgi:CheY-like chemotaxis protein